MDYAAATPCDPEVAALMARIAVEEFANPSSSHRSGRSAARIVERGREQVAEAVSALPEEIVFTSGATESNNLAILGVARFAEEADVPRRRLVTLGIEHPSVLEPCRHLARRGFELTIAPVQPDGRADLERLSELIRDDTLLVSVQAANNEIGTIQDLRAVVEIARSRGALVHSDATQALGKIPFNVEDLGLDFASFNAHKCRGPKGVGALWVSGGSRRAPIQPLLFGGGQERGVRPGTLNTAGAAGFGEAVSRAIARIPEKAPRLAALRDELEARLKERVPDLRINGAKDHRLPGYTSLTFPGVDADALVARLASLDLSTASACHSGTPEPSHVLRAIGLTAQDAYSTVRLALIQSSQDMPALAVALIDASTLVSKHRSPTIHFPSGRIY